MRKTTAALALVSLGSLGQACGHKALGIGEARGGAVGSGGSGTGAVATGGLVGSGGLEGGTGGNPGAGGAGGTSVSSIVGDCTSDTDCVAVLDYRAGFQCWFPTAASIADMSRDPCLVPWNSSNPRCPIVRPPSDCPGGPIAVNHSCPAYCRFVACAGGKCTLNSDFSMPSRCTQADAGAPPDCNALRATYLAALAAAQPCDPAKTPTSCFDAFYDSCGCPAAADLSGPLADALQCTLDALQQGQCTFGNCATPCSSGTVACAPDPTGATGTCTIR